jgi:hypothetical protein
MQNEVVVILGDVLAEGERDKVLQPPPDNLNLPNEQSEAEEVPNKPEVEETPVIAPNPLANTLEPPEPAKIDPNIVTGKRARLKPGTYAKMHKSGLSANLLEMENEGETESGIEFLEEGNDRYGLLQEYALAGAFGYEPKTLQEALETPNAKEWQAAHDYEVGQLEKLKMWRIVELPKGQYAIPHSEVFHKK